MATDAGRLGAVRAALLALFALLAFLPGQAALPPTDVDESRFVQATRQMLESGDYIDIRFQDQHRYKKPVGLYWLQVAAVKLTGGDASSPIWRYRLVSLLAAIASVVAAAGIAAYLFGRDAGFLSGLLFAVIFDLALEARIAKTDAALLLSCIVAQGALARLYVGARRGDPAGLSWLAFWIAQAAGILIKGPVTPLLSALTIAAIAMFDRNRNWLNRLRILPGLAVSTALVAPWLVAITLKSGGAFWSESIGKDLLDKVAAGQETHGFPPGFHFVAAALFLWPAAPIAMRGVLAALDKRREPAILFLLAWALPYWLVIEAIPTKLPNYILPAYPALAILGAWALLHPAPDAITGWRLWPMRLTVFGAVFATLVVAVLAAIAGPLVVGKFLIAGPLASLFVLLAGWLSVGGPGAPAEPLRRIAALAASGAIATGLIAAAIAPTLKPVWLSPQFAAAFKAHAACPQSRLASVGYDEPSLVFLTRTDTLLTDAAGASAHLSADPACALAIAPESAVAEIAAGAGKLETLETFTGFSPPGQEPRRFVLVRVAGKPALIHVLLDPEAITPTRTLSDIRAGR